MPEDNSLSNLSQSAALSSVASAALDAAQAQHADPPGEPTEAETLDAIVELDEAQAKGLSWEEAMRRVPPGVAKLMKSMQSDYTKKTQELADQRRELQRERESLLKVKFEAPEDVGEYDPFNEGSITKRIEAEVAKRMKQLLEPMQQEAELLKAEADYNSFLTSNPDFKTDTALRSEVQNLLELNPNLDLETAYWAAKGKQGKGRNAGTEGLDRARKEATRQAAQIATAPGRKGITPARPTATQARSMSNEDILAAAQALHRGG
jgi:hypothetical protein